MDLIDFYNANPTFFEAIFAPEYLELSRNALGQYSPGLRATCRTFARAIPSPKREYLRNVCNAAVEARNVELCAALCARDDVFPGFAASIIFRHASGTPGPQLGAISVCAFARMEATGNLEKYAPGQCQQPWKNDVFTRAFFGRKDIRSKQRCNIGSLATCPDPNIADIVREFLADGGTIMPGTLRIAALNCGAGATKLFDLLLPRIVPTDAIWDRVFENILANPGPCMLELVDKMFELRRAYPPSVFNMIAINSGPDAIRLLDKVLQHVHADSMRPIHCLHIAYNSGPCALELFKRFEHALASSKRTLYKVFRKAVENRNAAIAGHAFTLIGANKKRTCIESVLAQAQVKDGTFVSTMAFLHKVIPGDFSLNEPTFDDWRTFQLDIIRAAWQYGVEFPRDTAALIQAFARQTSADERHALLINEIEKLAHCNMSYVLNMFQFMDTHGNFTPDDWTNVLKKIDSIRDWPLDDVVRFVMRRGAVRSSP